MDKHRYSKIVTLLNQYDQQGIKFASAKQKLLKMGYNENEVEHALFEAPYDGEPNKKRIDPITQHFQNNPEAANRVAQAILKDDKQRHKTKILSNFFASRFAPGRHAQLYYEQQTADAIGYPYLTVMTLISIIGLVVMFTGLPFMIVYIACTIATLYWVYRFVKNLR